MYLSAAAHHALALAALFAKSGKHVGTRCVPSDMHTLGRPLEDVVLICHSMCNNITTNSGLVIFTCQNRGKHKVRGARAIGGPEAKPLLWRSSDVSVESFEE